MADGKTMKITYFVEKTEEITIDIPEGAQIRALEINGRNIPLTAKGEDLAQIISSFGLNALNIGGNKIPVPAIVRLAEMIPSLLGKIGIRIE